MPYKSKAQRRWMHANRPDLAAEWDAATPKGARLPEHVKKKARRTAATRNKRKKRKK